jgi:S-adenosylmethionine synthetase
MESLESDQLQIIKLINKKKKAIKKLGYHSSELGFQKANHTVEFSVKYEHLH